MRISTVAGVGSIASLLASVGVPIAFPHTEPWVGQYLLVAAGLLFALAIGLWWARKGSGDGGGTTQTTHGPHSPNYGTVRDVHNYYGPPNPAEKQERKSPHGSARYTWENLAGLERIMRGGSGPRGFSGPRLQGGRQLPDDRERCPEMPIHIALHWIATRIGDTDKADGFPQARQQFRQAAHDGVVDVWGQRQIPPQHMEDNRHQGVWTRIDPEHWEDHALHPRAIDKAAQEEPHTEEEEIGRISNRYWSLKVHEDDINRRWPKPLRTTNDGKP